MGECGQRGEAVSVGVAVTAKSGKNVNYFFLFAPRFAVGDAISVGRRSAWVWRSQLRVERMSIIFSFCPSFCRGGCGQRGEAVSVGVAVTAKVCAGEAVSARDAKK